MTMKFRKMIETGVKIAGGRQELAKAIQVRANQITDAKRKGLPVAACFKLAEIIDKDPAAVIAASELVTEKRPERRAVLKNFASRFRIMRLAL